MLPLYRDPWFTFRFVDDRLIARFHLDGVHSGQPVAVYRLDPETGRPGALLARAVAGPAGWVELPTPLRVRAGDSFAAAAQAEPG